MRGPCRINRGVRGGLIVAVLLNHGVRLFAGEDRSEQPAEEQATPALLERSRKLIADVRSLGPWPEQARLITQANRHVFEEYGWNSEPDRFAEDLMSRVAQIPPWDFMGRFELAMEALADRYELSPEQTAQIKQKTLWRTFGFFGKHASTMFDLTEEMLAARLERRPFSPEEVARWSRLGEPLVLDARAEFERLREEVEPLLNDRQREQLARDVAADNRRARTWLEKLGDWQQGKWEPEDWGLQDDPYHKAHVRRMADADGSERGVPEEPGVRTPEYDPADQDAWERYVRHFIQRYRLDKEQRTAARAILLDVRTRAGVYRSASDREAGGSSSGERLGRVYAQLFEELKRRLDQIPTAKQRRAAGPPVLPAVGEETSDSTAPEPHSDSSSQPAGPR